MIEMHSKQNRYTTGLKQAIEGQRRRSEKQIGRRKQQDVDQDYKNTSLVLMFMHGFQSRGLPGMICGMVILELGDSTADRIPKRRAKGSSGANNLVGKTGDPWPDSH